MKLQMKLAMFGTGIAVLAVLLVASISSFSTRLTLARFLADDERQKAQLTMDQIRQWHQQKGSWQEADQIFQEMAMAEQQQILLVDEEDRCVVSYPVDLCRSLIAVGPDHALKIRDKNPSGARVMELVGVPEISVVNDSGKGSWSLFVLPSGNSPRGTSSRFTSSMSQSLWIGGTVAALVALCVSFLLARTMLRPVRELVGVVKSMEGGDFSKRTTFRRQDEIGSLGLAFDSMAQKLDRQKRLRDDLFHDVAHELRTPLTNIRCQLESLQDGLAVIGNETLASLHEETMLLSRLVDDLRDIALAEAGQLGLEVEDCDVAVELRRVILMSSVVANARSVRLVLDAPASILVLADPIRLTQILNNLISNAIQHTPVGCLVTIRARPETDMALIEVKDDGVGIPSEHLPFVFDRFYRADPVRSRKSGGAGLGLAIVKQLATLQGGSVRVTSSDGHGCCFELKLPLRPGESEHCKNAHL